MELGEVVNPHYAFPVVGVILCVLLVFAFGFKSPVQPPSFDSLEEEKKNIPKKRSKSTKSKENHKVKVQQNGRVGGSPTSKQLPDTTVQQTAVNSMIVDKQNNKSDAKNKKTRLTTNVPRQKVEQSETVKNKMTATSSEDNTEGEWVQQLSKKERKHRRKEEVANACVTIESDKNSDNGIWDEHQTIAELSSGSQVSTPLKGSPKQNTKNKSNAAQQTNQDTEVQKNLKKKPKKDVTTNQTEINNLPAKYEEPPKENKEVETEQYNEIPNTSIEIYNEMGEEISSTDEKTKKKKGKKKTQEANAFSGKLTPNEDFISSKKPISLEDTIEGKREPLKTKNNVTDMVAAENATNSTKDSQSSEPKHENKNDASLVTERGSNVVFDELGDIWQDAKSQKKKKKARRDQ